VSEEQIESLLEVANEKMGTNLGLESLPKAGDADLIGIKEFGTWDPCEKPLFSFLRGNRRLI